MARRSPRISLVLKQTKTLGGRVAKDPVKRESTARNAIIKSEEVDDGQSPQRLIEPEFVHFPASAMPNLEAATKHLCSVDPRFGPLFDRFTPKPWTQEGLLKPKNHFRSLVLGVLSQQVSGAAARSIGKRFVALFMQYPNAPNVDMDPEVEDVASIIPNIKVEAVDQPRLSTASITHDAAPANAEDMDAFPAPEDVAQREVLYLKSAGLSLRKAEYVKGIAEAFLSGHLNEEFFATANDEEIKKRLISIRGLGPWSAEMFMVKDYLMFSSGVADCDRCSRSIDGM